MPEALPEEIVRALPRWKEEYGDVFLWNAGDTTLVYRGCSFREFDEYHELHKHNVNEAEEYIVKAGVLHPDSLDLDALPVSIVTTLSKNILEGGLLHEKEPFFEKLEEARTQANTYLGLGTALIAHAFFMDPDDVRNFTLSKFTRYFAMAEVVLQRKFEPNNKSSNSKAKGSENPNTPNTNKINFVGDSKMFREMGYGRENFLGT